MVTTHLIKETSVTGLEKYDTGLFYLSLNTFDPLVTITMFSS